jgi:hypothetical protein
MYRKKEIISIISIILITLILAFLPTLLSKTKVKMEDVDEETKTSTIIISIDGEVTRDDLSIEVPYGASYGYILSKIKIYLNSYSIIDSDLTKQYYESQTITIASSDIDCYTNEEIYVDSTKISLSTASYDELISLYGIGQKRAETLIEYRESHTLDSWETIRSLLGVSNEVIENIQEKAVL